MSLRRPSLRSTAYMLVLAVGILLAGALIWRGAGAPREPARVMVPVERAVYLDSPGSYIVFAEQVIAPRSMQTGELRTPEIDLRLSSGEGQEIRIGPPGLGCWLVKVLTRGRGHTMGVFEVESPGDVTVRAAMAKVAGRVPDCNVVLAFVPAVSAGRLLWLLLGFGGQIFFSLRFIIQWLASERVGRSTVPRAFWYYSLIGGLMILAYAIYTRDPVFILAYAFNSFIYVRNLVLISRENRLAECTDAGVAAEGNGSEREA